MYKATVVRRWSSVALSVSAAAAFAVSVGSGRWWSVGGGSFEIGPLGTQQCTGGDCRPVGMPLDAGPRFVRAATASAAAGFIAVLILLIVAGAIAARRTPKLLARLCVASLVTCVLAAALFVSTFPSETLPTAELARGFYLYALGVVLGAGCLLSAPRNTAS